MRKTKIRLFAALLAAVMALLTVTVVGAQTPRTASATLTVQNNSGISGTATLTDLGNNTTRVEVKLTGQPAGNSSPGHIHFGTCATLGGIKFPLTNAENNASVTTVNASLANIINEPVAINFHKSAQEISVYTACGNIGVSNAPAAPASGAGGTQTETSWLALILLGAFGIVAAGAGASLYARRNAR